MRNKILARNDSAREYAMSQPALPSTPLPFDIIFDDGNPLETAWHSLELPLLRDVVRQAMAEQGRADFYIGTNMFLYYSVEQARDVAAEEKGGRPCLAYRGPDFYWVGGVDPSRNRPGWVAWEEGGRLPSVILELLSPFTAHKDRTERKDLYEQVLRTKEYFMYEPETRRLEGLRLAGSSSYQPIPPDEQGRLWSEELGVSFGLWYGVVEGRKDDWVRLFWSDGSLVPTNLEALKAVTERYRAEADRLEAEANRLRAEAAETELARLRSLLEERGRD